MPKPTFLMFVMSIIGLLLFAYYRTVGKGRAKSTLAMNWYMLYVMFAISCIIFIWGVAAMIFKNG